MKELDVILERMEPAAALKALTPGLKKILEHISEEARVKFVTGIIEESGGDKISSMVNL